MNHQPIHILSTKILDDAILKQAAFENIVIECVPFIETKSIVNTALQQQINEAAKKLEYAVFTSANAVKAVAENITVQPVWQIFCISGATKDAVAAHFGQCEIVAAENYGKDLAEKIIQHKISEVVFFCGSKRLNTIPDALKADNIQMKEVVVYETVLTPQKLEKSYNGILFFSPSAVESFFSVNSISEDVVTFAIGNTTAKALEKFCKRIEISNLPSEIEVLNKIRSFYV